MPLMVGQLGASSGLRARELRRDWLTGRQNWRTAAYTARQAA